MQANSLGPVGQARSSPAGTPVWSALDLAVGVVVSHSHAIRLANTAVNQILAAQQAPLGIGPPAPAAGLCGRLTEQQDCESAIHA